jgi:hypothetical protein
MEVSKADFARMAGVSKAAISKKSKNKRLIVNSAGFIDTDNPVNRMYLEKHQRKAQAKALNTGIPATPAMSGALPGILPGLSAGATAPGGALSAQPAQPALDVAQLEPPAQTAPGAALSAQPMQPTPAASARRTSAGNITVSAGYVTDANRMLNMTLRELLQNYNGLDGVEKYAKILKDLMAADERAQRIQERRRLQIPKDFVISRLFGYLNQQNSRLLDLPESMADQVIALAQTGAAQATTAQTGAPAPQSSAPVAPTTAPQADTTLQTGTTNPQEIAQIADVALSVESVLIENNINPDVETAVSLNDTRQKIVNYLRDNITRCIGGAKQAVISELKMLQAKYSEADNTQDQLNDIYEALNEN